MPRVTPKQNWTGSNVPLAPDFNRIEGNSQQAFDEIDQVLDEIENEASERQAATEPFELLTRIKTVDGSGSGLDSDTVRTFIPNGIGGFSKISYASYSSNATLGAMDLGEIRYVANTDIGSSHVFTKPPGTTVIIMGTVGFVIADAYAISATTGNNILVFIRIG